MTKNLTEGFPAKLILQFAVPLLIGNLFQQLYSMADMLIVGRTIGVNALAAVGCTGSITFFILGFAMGVTAGLSILTAQRFGAGDERGVKRSFATGAQISMVVTAGLTVLAVPTTRLILEAMNTPAEIIDDAYAYLFVIFVGIFASMLFNFLSNIIRALGDSRMPLIFLVVACVVNIVLDYALIRGAGMGVEGAAVATVASQVFSGVLCLVYIWKRMPILHLSKSDWRSTQSEMKHHLLVSVPMGFQMSIIAIGTIVLQAVLNGLGALAVAAFSAASKIDMMANLPLSSFGTAMATYVAQNYGAGLVQRIRQGVFQCCLMSLAFSVAIGLVNILAGYQLAGVFVGSSEPQLQSLAQTYLRITGALYWVLALLYVFRNTLQGLGDSLVPTIAGVMELIMRTFAAVVLASFMGFAGACWAGPLAWIGACAPMAVAYVRSVRKLEKKYGGPRAA
ncbi:MAG: MATE family efflux transporter [Lachnospiraceae bacterium]|jgi:putative MATE family efflux protein|nr:MATE family efflux transporter [Lachnospiraceae bacterium]